MCIIIGKPLNVDKPSDETLRYCATANRDGIGIAYTRNNHVCIKKDFADVEAFITWLGENIKVTDACMIHFRNASTGAEDQGNRHPFPLTRKNKRLRAVESITDIAVAHNGTFKDFGSHKKYSDTLLFIKEVLADPIIRNNIASEAISELIKGYIGTSKLAMLHRDGSIVEFGTFYQEHGLLYSNTNWKANSYASGCAIKQCNKCYIVIHEWRDWNYKDGIVYCNGCFKILDTKLITESKKGGDDNA